MSLAGRSLQLHDNILTIQGPDLISIPPLVRLGAQPSYIVLSDSQLELGLPTEDIFNSALLIDQ